MSGYTCIACRVAFHDADLQRGHYKTDWHRYNLKRKVADMPPVTAENFQERVLAQKAQVENEAKDMSSHCSVCNKHFNTENAFQNHIQSKKHQELAARQPHSQDGRQTTDNDKSLVTQKNEKNSALKAVVDGSALKAVVDGSALKVVVDGSALKAVVDGSALKAVVDGSALKAVEDGSESTAEAGLSSSSVAGPSLAVSQDVSHDVHMDEDADSDDGSWESWEGEALSLEECLFCSHVSANLDKNIKHMTLSHSFFLPDIEYLSDLEGFLGYLAEKVGEGHICLWCNAKSKAFRTTKAVQQHMIDKGHCKVLHDGDVVFEYADYYDYRSSYPDYVAGSGKKPVEDGEEEEEEETPDVLDEGNYQLVLPSGSVIGHRSLQRYFRQKLRPDRQVALKNSNSITRAMAQYKALGWAGANGPLVQKKAKDLSHFRRVYQQSHMRLGVKANIMQHHYREQVFF